MPQMAHHPPRAGSSLQGAEVGPFFFQCIDISVLMCHDTAAAGENDKNESG